MWFRRRKIIVDPKLQFAVASHVAGVVVAVGAIYVGALLILPDQQYQPMPGNEVRDLLIRMNLMYAGLAAFLMVALALVLTHRIAGPMRVLESALQGIRAGDYGRRMVLRKRDYLQTLAAEIEALAKHLQAGDQERAATLRVLESCLRERDVDGAREILTRLLGTAEAPKPVEAAAGQFS
jgi:signal transduction histidine kinase